MSVSAPLYYEASQNTGIRLDRVANACLALAVFSGGFVIFEPAPYEVFLAGLIGVFFLLGLRIPNQVVPLLIPVFTLTLGGIISASLIEQFTDAVIYNLITLFLGLTSVFFAIVIKQDMGRIRLIMRAYVVAAVCTSVLGIAGYFGVPGLEMFTRYDRAMGAFADPNVFAPFLCIPILYLVYGVMTRSVAMLPVRGAMLAILLLGLLLAGSRAGWGLMVATAGMFYILLLMTSGSNVQRAKLILLGVFGLVGVVLAVIAALQVDAVWDIIQQRAKLVQEYDGHRLGRFARHLIGFELALSKPLGIGTLQFGVQYGEDEHNVYLRALLTYGWIGFLSWITLVFTPMIVGFKNLFLPRPWQPYFQIAYVAMLGHLFVGWVIDIDHWRHVYLTLGLLWGCIILEWDWRRVRAESSKHSS